MATIPNQIHLQWNHFTADVSSAFRQLRKDEDFCDVTLGCSDSKGSSLKAHKVILSASSETFRQILREDYSQKEHPNPYIYLKGIAFSDLKLLLDFIYNGEVTLSKENLKSFLKVAKELEIRALCKTQGNNKEPKQTDNEKVSIESKDATTESTKTKKKGRQSENEDFDSDNIHPPPSKSPKSGDTDSEMYPLSESPVRVDPETGMIPQSPERIDPETGLITEERVDPETGLIPEDTIDPETGFIPEERMEDETEPVAEEKIEEDKVEFHEERLELTTGFIQEHETTMAEAIPDNLNPNEMEEEKPIEEPKKAAEEINIFKCRLCEFECSKPKTMRNHLKNTHSDLVKSNKNNNNGDRNNEPTIRGRSSEEGKREKKSDINCSDCFRFSTDLQSLDRHIKEAHVKNKLRVTSESDM